MHAGNFFTMSEVFIRERRSVKALAALNIASLFVDKKGRPLPMANRLIARVVLFVLVFIPVTQLRGVSSDAQRQDPGNSTSQPVNSVIQWNRTLLVIVRTPGAQPATIHPTRSFAMMHAAIYDAVNAIDRTHKPYLIRLSGVPRSASQEAAAVAAAHDVLVALYPNFQSALDSQLQTLARANYRRCR